MGSLPAPKSPSSLVKVSRWSLLLLGVSYGNTRYGMLKKKEDKRRAKEEEERPAREAAMKAEKERKNQEEMVYLAEQAGVKNKGTGGGDGGSEGGGAGGGAGMCTQEYRSACGCSY